MFYAILGIIVVVALFLIFRDDHDDSYNKSEKGQRKAQQTRSFSHTQGQSQPKKEQILGEIEQAISEAKKGAEEPMKVFSEVMGIAKEAVNTAMITPMTWRRAPKPSTLPASDITARYMT